MTKFFTLSALCLAGAKAVAVSSFTNAVPMSYNDYVENEEKPVCEKHVEGGPGMCQLFKSCHFDEFRSGKTGSTWCQSTCNRFKAHFPRQMCLEDNRNEIDATKWTLDETNNQVCWRRSLRFDPVCVGVDGFVDIGVDQRDEIQARLADAGASQCEFDNCLSVSLIWDNSGSVKNDLDIYLDTPAGRIYYGRSSVGGGRLDTDAGRSTVNAVENIIFDNGAPSGHYTISVDNYSQSGAGVKDFKVAVVRDGGAMQIFEGSATNSRGNMHYVYSFDF